VETPFILTVLLKEAQKVKKLSRREMLRLMGYGAAGAALAGCATPTPETITVVETQIVEIEGEEVEVTRVVEVEKEVEVEVTAVPTEVPPVDVIIKTSDWPVRVVKPEDIEANPLDQAYFDAVQAFLDQYPGLQLEQVDVDIWDTEGIMAQVVAGTDCTYLYGPCVGGGWGRENAVNAFVQGLLADVTPLVFKWGMHEKSLPHLWENWSANSQVDGKYFSFSLNEYAPSAGTLIYRKDLIDEKGLKEPEIGWTVEEWFELCRGLTEGDFTGAAVAPWFLSYTCAMHGWDVLTQVPVPGEPWHWTRDLTGDPRWVEICEQFNKMIFEDKAILVDVALGGGDEEYYNLFRNGQTGMARFNYWSMFGEPGEPTSLAAMAEEAGKEFADMFGAAPLPMGDGYQYGSGVDIWGPVCFSPNDDAGTHDYAVGLVDWMFWGEGLAITKQGAWEESKDPRSVYTAFLYMDGREQHPGVPATPVDAFGEALVQRWRDIGKLPVEPPQGKYYPAEENPQPSNQAIDDQLNLMVTGPGPHDYGAMLAQGEADWKAQAAGFASSVSEAQFVVASQQWYAALDGYLKTNYPDFYENRFKPYYEGKVLPAIS
jgi:hypothetical protein